MIKAHETDFRDNDEEGTELINPETNLTIYGNDNKLKLLVSGTFLYNTNTIFGNSNIVKINKSKMNDIFDKEHFKDYKFEDWIIGDKSRDAAIYSNIESDLKIKKGTNKYDEVFKTYHKAIANNELLTYDEFINAYSNTFARGEVTPVIDDINKTVRIIGSQDMSDYLQNDKGKLIYTYAALGPSMEGDTKDVLGNVIVGNNTKSENVTNGIVLGNNSIGVSNALSIGGYTLKDIGTQYTGKDQKNPTISKEDSEKLIKNLKPFTRKLVFMSKGDINETSTDGINGSQLYSLMNAKDDNGILINVDAWKNKLGIKPSNVEENNVINESKLDKNFNNYDISNNVSVATKLSQGANLDTPTGTLVTDTMVKEKLDTKADKSSVYTKEETYNRNEIDNKFKNIDFSKVNNEVNKLKGGVANAMALAGLPQVNYNSKFSIGAGTGYYDKTGALALGISGQTTNHRIVYKIAASISTSKKIGLNAGINYNFGNINENNKNIDLKEQNDKLAKQEKEIQLLKEQLNKLANRNNELDYIIDNFEFNDYNLSREQIKQINNLLTKINNYNQIIIIGYSDTRGADKYNLDLGLNRAKSVKNYLINKGINVNNITIKSSGYNTILGHDSSRNRRVEIIIK